MTHSTPCAAFLLHPFLPMRTLCLIYAFMHFVHPSLIIKTPANYNSRQERQVKCRMLNKAGVPVKCMFHVSRSDSDWNMLWRSIHTQDHVLRGVVPSMAVLVSHVTFRKWSWGHILERDKVFSMSLLLVLQRTLLHNPESDSTLKSLLLAYLSTLCYVPCGSHQSP